MQVQADPVLERMEDVAQELQDQMFQREVEDITANIRAAAEREIQRAIADLTERRRREGPNRQAIN